MTDINTEYKSRFHALTEQLGRVPDTRDKEWWVLTDWYRHNVNSFTSGTGRGGDVPSRSGARETEQDMRAREGQGDQSLTEPPRLTADWSEAGSQPDGPSGSPRNSERAMTASERDPSAPLYARGPSGGVMAVCSECERTWERPKTRGRPSYKCGECR